MKKFCFEKSKTLKLEFWVQTPAHGADQPDFCLMGAAQHGEMWAPHACVNVMDTGSDGAPSHHPAGGSETRGLRSRTREAPWARQGPRKGGPQRGPWQTAQATTSQRRNLNYARTGFYSYLPLW